MRLKYTSKKWTFFEFTLIEKKVLVLKNESLFFDSYLSVVNQINCDWLVFWREDVKRAGGSFLFLHSMKHNQNNCTAIMLSHL